MAMFQQYQGGIAPIQGISEAGARIGQMSQQGFADLSKSLAEGIAAYNENSAKNDLANQKIQMLGQDVANKIAMYSQDPEIAQSGVLQGLMQTAATLQDAPTKGLNQRLGIVHEAETRLAGFGQQLQEWSFLRGRAIERGISEALNQYAGKVKSTEAVNLDDPNFSVNPNESIVQQKDRVMKYFGEIKKVNPNVQFNDQEFWQRWLAKAEQSTAKAQNIDPRIISAQLEAINAEKGITARQAEGFDLMDYDSEVKDLQGVMQKPSEAPAIQEKQYQQDVADALEFFGAKKKDEAQSEIATQAAKQVTLEEKAKIMTYEARLGALKRMESMLEKGAYPYEFKQGGTQGRDYNPGILPSFFEDVGERTERAIFGSTPQSRLAEARNKYLYGDEKVQPSKETANMSVEERQKLARLVQEGKIKFGENGNITAQQLFKEPKTQAEALLGKGTPKERAEALSYIKKQIQETNSSITSLTKAKTDEKKLAKNIDKSIELGLPISKTSAEPAKVAPIGIGDVVVGTVDTERPISVNERKAQVQDFLTQRFGAIDPTDPTGKRRVPVQGFEQFFKKAVPESEIQEYTTPSGIRLMYMNGKWEQMKMPEQRSIQDIRKEMVGVYGQQTRDGRLVPTEFVPNSGIMIGGLYRGGDAEEKEFKTEMVQLADARRSIKRLQEINDKVGEFANFKLSGEAEVEVMNLKAALRKDIIGVGTVSNFEQSLIDKVIANPTSFFSMESRDRAILLALAQRVDRRIRNLSAAGGLTVQIRDTDSESGRYEELRKRYLREKYGI